MNSYDSEADNVLPSWVDFGECCDWERVKCNTITGHVTKLSFNQINNNLRFISEPVKLWPLNVSLFLQFEELRSLNLSMNFLDNAILNTELETLSSLKNLEILDLTSNYDIDNDIIPSLTTLTSLRVLDLSYTSLKGRFPTTGIIRYFEKLRNFGSNRVWLLWYFSNTRNLDLSGNRLSGSFPAYDLAYLTNLEKLDFSGNKRFTNTSIIQELSRLKDLKTLDMGACGLNSLVFNGTMSGLLYLNLDWNVFRNDSLRFLGAFPSLKFLSLESSRFNRAALLEELPYMPNLEVLLLGRNKLRGKLTMKALSSFPNLEILDLSSNNLNGSIPSEISALSYMRVLYLAENNLNGSLLEYGLCQLKNLQELDLSLNSFEGNLPQCFSNLSSLKVFEISSNHFTGIIPQFVIANMTSLEYINLCHNKFEGLLSFSSLANLRNLVVVEFKSNNDKFEVDTEEPLGWMPMFQLQVLVLSNSNVNMHKGNVVPSFLLHQHELQVLDLSHNSLQGHTPNWLVENNTMLQSLYLRNNSFGGSIRMPSYRDFQLAYLDMSDNEIMGSIPGNIGRFCWPQTYVTRLARAAV
ncbi:receptor like protein 1 [Artemisia annua]|uniref:Receptor like protein 1 n=1 Tax=Artemisia annua TaxID=35608 RepID=A0A2U1MNX7_ARTAN|nr:receptor like protein 1 [Artemisia annua]